MTLTDLAKQLEISTAQASRLAKRGMPIDSVESAEAWRRVHLNPSWMVQSAPRGQRMATSTGSDGARELAQARTAIAMGERALAAGQLPAITEVLRSALAAVPQDRRAEVDMSVELWDALTEDVYQAVASMDHAADGTPPATTDGPPVPASFWYAAAAGEARVVADSEGAP